jgi:hypothetical protein
MQLRDIRKVEILSEVRDLNPQKGLPTVIRPLLSVPTVGELGWNTSTELAANHRILKHLAEQGNSIQSSRPMAIATVESIWHAADRAGMLIEGEQGYADTKTLWGHIGKAQLQDGSRVVFATLQGMEHSNDHYPY